jgi:hypothetical protein
MVSLSGKKEAGRSAMGKLRSAICQLPFPAPHWSALVLLLAVVNCGAYAQLIIERTVTVNQMIPDRGQYVSTLVWENAGLSSISQVAVDLALSSPSATNPMWLGDMFASLTHGTASEMERVGTVFNYFGSDPDNSATTLNHSFTFESQFNGAWLASNKWSLLVADRAQGGTGRLDSWKLRITGAPVSTGTIAVNSGGTLLLGAANQISDSTQVTMAGGTVALAAYDETAGRLAVTADSVFDFGTAGAGTNTFTFADFDTAGYGGVAGLTFTNVGIGSKVVFSTDYTGNTTFNAFTSKINFSDESLQGQISFSGGTTTLTVAAIPDARVYTAAVVLIILIGWTEYRRRRRPCRR